jgi:hypothetical protein
MHSLLLLLLNPDNNIRTNFNFNFLLTYCHIVVLNTTTIVALVIQILHWDLAISGFRFATRLVNQIVYYRTYFILLLFLLYYQTLELTKLTVIT